MTRLFSGLVITFKPGILHEDVKDSIRAIVLKFLELQYAETLIGWGQSTDIFPFGEKKRILSLTKAGLLKVK